MAAEMMLVLLLVEMGAMVVAVVVHHRPGTLWSLTVR
jgi:hypothetical protein